MWIVGKYIGTYNCEMETFSGNHFNLNVDLISLVLIPYIEVSIRYKIKECITFVHEVYGFTITKKRHFSSVNVGLKLFMVTEISHFADLPRYMAVLQHFNLGTVVEWKLERSPGILEYIFRYVFWAFKPAIDGFVHCRPVISIDDTHVYREYDIKLLIAVAVDANESIFPLAFAICANESQEIWTLLLNHLKDHVVKHRSSFVITRYVDKEYIIAAYLNTYSGQLQPVGAEHYWPPELFKMVCNKDYVRQ
ncbi:uncharacterized protein [Nicotiana tomentosiformis]|uniref:uncharacterized protein n=1 Tax=Nicotiana tomentosiformis TaxID=4098 RepID=UPI00388CDF8A